MNPSLEGLAAIQLGFALQTRAHSQPQRLPAIISAISESTRLLVPLLALPFLLDPRAIMMVLVLFQLHLVVKESSVKADPLDALTSPPATSPLLLGPAVYLLLYSPQAPPQALALWGMCKSPRATTLFMMALLVIQT